MGEKMLSRTSPDDAVWNHQGMHEPHLLSITVKETGHKENLPITEWPIRSSTAETGRVNFYLLQYTIIEPVWQDFFWKNLIFFSEQLLWTFEDFKGKKRKTEENDSYHGLEWIGMINQNVSWFFLPKFHKTSNCPFYRPSGGFNQNRLVNIMHIHFGNMQLYTLASKNLFLQFILWAPEMGWNCPTMPHSDKNDKIHENGSPVSENKYILLPMVKKKSIMRKQQVLAAPSHGLFCMDRTRFVRFAMNALRGAWPPVPAFLDTPFIFAIYY